MQIYPAEQSIAHLMQDDFVTCEMRFDVNDSGLTPLLARAAAKFKAAAEPEEEEEESESVVEELAPSEHYLQNNRDIAWWPAILVTSNWNKNDDVFTPRELAKGAKTPLLKPVNWMHKIGKGNNEVIGVINSTVVVDEFHKEIEPEDITTDDHKIHIAVGMVIWSKMFPSYAADIQKGLKDNKMFVSMECWVSDFGYALRAPNSDQIILLDRTAETAGLSKHLKWFKGPGFVDINGLRYRIGRWIKNPLFAAVGCVYRPANEESVPLFDGLIGQDPALFKLVAATDFDESGVLLLDSDNKGDTMKEDKVACSCDTMKAELDAAKAALDAAKAEVDAAKAETAAAKSEAASTKAALETAQAEVAASASRMKEFEAKASAVEANVAALSGEIEKISAAKSEIETKYAEIHKREVGRERLGEMRDYIDVEDESKLVAEFGGMSDTEYGYAKKFAIAAAGGVKKMTDQTVSSQPKLTDQTVTSVKKMTDVVAKAEADVSAVEAVSAIAQAGAAPESVNELGMRLGKQLAANYKKR